MQMTPAPTDTGNSTPIPTSNRRSEAIAHLCDAVVGLTSSIRSIACGAPTDTWHFKEMFQTTEDALKAFAQMPNGWQEDTMGIGDDEGGMVLSLSHVAEQSAMAAQRLSAGGEITDRAVFVNYLAAEGKLGEMMRLIRKDRYVPLVKQLWGPKGDREDEEATAN
ncbi:hypothetical protein G6N74_04280 [Mesorhizobium sp. CGMCC 1.15528]|uniref:Uncharacterized protein n=1 Tax=Mesorhizobium zhangyense TaxID=1776730 RepID=A0A7C9VAN7_9HYPH|nr:hypothetical protein [Mesorhizobium zhangyense]NGN40271.1 hypothetical protein [Mesorhizobium zhangyense]